MRAEIKWGDEKQLIDLEWPNLFFFVTILLMKSLLQEEASSYLQAIWFIPSLIFITLQLIIEYSVYSSHKNNYSNASIIDINLRILGHTSSYYFLGTAMNNY